MTSGAERRRRRKKKRRLAAKTGVLHAQSRDSAGHAFEYICTMNTASKKILIPTHPRHQTIATKLPSAPLRPRQG